MGKANEARKILRRLQGLPQTQFVSPMSIVAVYCALGDEDHALQWLEKAIDQRDASVSDIPSLPFLDPLRDDPRFPDLLTPTPPPSHDSPTSDASPPAPTQRPPRPSPETLPN